MKAGSRMEPSLVVERGIRRFVSVEKVDLEICLFLTLKAYYDAKGKLEHSKAEY